MKRMSDRASWSVRSTVACSVLCLAVSIGGASRAEAVPPSASLGPTISMMPGPSPAGPAAGTRLDTIWYGGYRVYAGEYYAIPDAVKENVVWSFDHGIGPQGDPSRIENGEGWAASDPTRDEQVFFRVIDAALDLGAGVGAPVLSGEQSLWVGASAREGNDYHYDCLAGYGNGWNQRAVSEPLAYDGSGAVQLSFLYYQDSETGFDATQVFLAREDGSTLLLNPSGQPDLGFTGRIGIDAQGNITPALFERSILPGEIGGAQEIRFLIEFTSDGGWSDEDCDYPTTKGPFAVDDIRIQGGGIDRAYSFETGEEGWTLEMGDTSSPSLAGIADIDCYMIHEPCLSGNILEVHADTCTAGFHPPGQFVLIESPACNLGTGWEGLFLELDMYWETIGPSLILWRPGWRYYPDPGPLGPRWSERVGDATYYAVDGQACIVGAHADASGHVPPTAEKVIAVIEIVFSEEFPAAYPSPFFDNLVVGRVGGLPAADVADDGANGAGGGGGDREAALLLSARPSPVRDATNISFRLTGPKEVRLEVFDLGGRLIRTLLAGPCEAGERSVLWEATDGAGRKVTPGVYWVRISAGDRLESRKIVVLD